MGKSVGLLNNIRINASQEYQNRIPEATQDNIAAIGNALATYTVLANEFWSSLINKIGKTILEQKLFQNKLARFKSGAITSQQDVEEIFIEMSKAEGAYDKNGPNPLGRRTGPDVKTVYHRMNRQDKYVVSIGDLDVLRVFRSEATLDSFISGLINSVYSGANYDEWLAMKELLCTYDGYTTAYVGAFEPGVPENNTMWCMDFVKTIRKLVNDLSVAPSDKYNKAGVMTWSNPSDLVLLVNKDILAEVDVEVLSKAFNMGKTDIQIEVIPMDDFSFAYDNGSLVLYGGIAQPHAILMDKDFFRVWDTLSHMEAQRNADGLFTNYFYHVHQILSLSPFKNAVLIGTNC